MPGPLHRLHRRDTALFLAISLLSGSGLPWTLVAPVRWRRRAGVGRSAPHRRRPVRRLRRAGRVPQGASPDADRC